MSYDVEKFSAEIEMKDFVESCVDIPKFDALCRECPGYDKTWMCPPFDFDSASVWRRFSRIRLVVRKLTPLTPADTPDRRIAEASAAIAAEKSRLTEELRDEESRHEGSLSCFLGSCSLCEKCTRPEGRACRFPDRARHSIEAIGADVGKACEKYLGVKILWGTKETQPKYYILAGALLMK